MKTKKIIIFTAAMALLLSVPFTSGANINHTVIATIPVGDFPVGVGINPKTNLIYVSNLNIANVSVIDGYANSVIDVISVENGPRGIGVNSTTNRIYINNSSSNSISVIDGTSNAVIDTIAGGAHPADQVGINENTNRIYVPNFNDNTVTVIDGKNNSIIATIPVGDSPRGIAVNPSTNRIYAVNSFDDTVSVIDGATNNVTKVIPVGFFPSFASVNSVTNRIYVANAFDDTVSVVDGNNNTIVDTLSVGDQPIGVANNINKNLVYVTNGLDGTLSIVDANINSVIETVSVGSSPGPVDFNSFTNRVYVANNHDDTVSVLSASIFSNPTDFNNATISLRTPTIIDFEDIDASPLNNTYLGRDEFAGDYYISEGIVFSNPNDYPLYIAPGGLFWNESNSLSVGRFPADPAPPIFNADDDHIVNLDPPCAAFGFTFVDNGEVGRPDEFVQYFDSEGRLIAQVGFPPDYENYRAFLGIVSTDQPISEVNIVETPPFDDVNYDDFTCYRAVLEISIDIKPGSYPNSINLKSKGKVPVAILATADFDADDVDPDTCVFAGASPVRWNMEDVDNDGDHDMLLHFKTQELDLTKESTEATLVGETIDEVQITGTDSVNIVPKGNGYGKKGKKGR